MKRTFTFLNLSLNLNLIFILMVSSFLFSNILWADEWVELNPPTKPKARYGHTMVEINGNIYLFGGAGSLPTNDLWKFDGQNHDWTLIDPSAPPPARHSHSAAVSNGKMYIFFGMDGEGNPLSDIYSYDPATNHWTQEPSGGATPMGRYNHSTVTLPGGRIYLIGGKSGPTKIADSFPFFTLRVLAHGR